MTVITSPGIILSTGDIVDDGNNPIIGYDNLVTTANVAATTENSLYPATNLANPSTNLKWQASSGSPTFGEEFLTFDLQTTQQIDYIGIARHNFGTGQFPVSIEAVTEEPGSPADWDVLISDTLLPDDKPVIFRFTPQAVHQIRLRIGESLLSSDQPEPFAAVAYVGKLLVLQRRLFVGHTPISYGRRTKLMSARSESGNFLGRLVLREMRETNVQSNNLTEAWYRENFEPFVEAAQESPFFFNWRPGDYPYESGYVWTTEDIQPGNALPNGMMSVSFSISGIAR